MLKTKEPQEKVLELQIERANAHSRMKEVWGNIQCMRSLLDTFHKDYFRWKARYESADNELAHLDGRLKKVATATPGQPKTLTDDQLAGMFTREQLLAMASALQAKIGIEQEVNETLNGEEVESDE